MLHPSTLWWPSYFPPPIVFPRSLLHYLYLFLSIHLSPFHFVKFNNFLTPPFNSSSSLRYSLLLFLLLPAYLSAFTFTIRHPFTLFSDSIFTSLSPLPHLLASLLQSLHPSFITFLSVPLSPALSACVLLNRNHFSLDFTSLSFRFLSDLPEESQQYSC